MVEGELFGGVLLGVVSWVLLEDFAAALEGVEKFVGTFVEHVEAVAFQAVQKCVAVFGGYCFLAVRICFFC